MSSAVLDQAVSQFRENRLFDGVPPHVLEEIAPQIEVAEFAENDVVFREGDSGDVLYLVGKGSVRISKVGRGGQQETLGLIGGGSFFGEMALLDHEPRSATATAAEPTVLGSMRDDAFKQILEIAPSRLHMNFLHSVSERLRRVNSHFITEMMRNERLSLVGAMANSIIHDLKNPIHAHSLLLPFYCQRKQRSAPGRIHKDDRRGNGRNGGYDPGIARLRARIEFVHPEKRVDLAIAG